MQQNSNYQDMFDTRQTYCLAHKKPKIYNNLSKLLDKHTFQKHISTNTLYTNIPFCIWNHIKNYIDITTGIGLSPTEQIHYLYYLVSHRCSIAVHNRKEVIFSAAKLGGELNCSESTVLSIQKSLECRGYLTVKRSFNKFGSYNRNMIIPIIPEGVFKRLQSLHEDKFGYHDDFDKNKESYIDYLVKTKLYVPIFYKDLKQIFHSNVSPKAKSIYIDFLFNFHRVKGNSIHICYKTMMSEYRCSKATISNSLDSLVKQGLITKTKTIVPDKCDSSNRFDKYIWKIDIISKKSFDSKKLEISDTKRDVQNSVGIVQDINEYNKRNRIKDNKVNNLYKTKSCEQKLYIFNRNSLEGKYRTMIYKYAKSVAKKIYANPEDINKISSRLYKEYLHTCVHWQSRIEYISIYDKIRCSLNMCMKKTLKGQYTTPNAIEAAIWLDKEKVDIGSKDIMAFMPEAIKAMRDEKKYKKLCVPDEYKEILGSCSNSKLQKLINFVLYNCQIDEVRMLLLMQKFDAKHMYESFDMTQEHWNCRNFTYKMYERQFLRHLYQKTDEYKGYDNISTTNLENNINL